MEESGEENRGGGIEGIVGRRGRRRSRKEKEIKKGERKINCVKRTRKG